MFERKRKKLIQQGLSLRSYAHSTFDAQVGSLSGAASDFIKPFVSRYGYPDLDQVRTASKPIDGRFALCLSQR